MADVLKPEGLSDENWTRLKDKISWPFITTVDGGLRLTSWAQLDAIINLAVAAARAQGPSTSGADEREEIARLTSRIDEERAKAASYPLGDPMCSRHGGIRDGLKEALEIILARAQGPGEAISDERAREFVEAAYAPPTPLARELMDKLKASYGPGEAVAREAAFIVEQATLSMTGHTSRLNAIIAAAERIIAATPTREA